MKRTAVKIVCLILLLSFVLPLVSGCGIGEAVRAAFFSVDVASLECSVTEHKFTKADQSLILDVDVFPLDATDKSLKYVSSNESVAVVDAFGKVTPVGNGTAYITAYPEHGIGSVSCRIDVDFTVYVDGITLSENTLEFTMFGETKQLTATVSPLNATNLNISWSVGNDSIATVDEDGAVTAVSNGETLVEAKTEDGGYVAACIVTVNCFIDIEDVEFDIREFTFENVDDTLVLTPQFVPANTTERGLVWSSSNEKVVTVTPDGRVTPVGNGTATVQALSANGKKVAKCKVTVDLPVHVQGIRLDGTEYVLEGAGQNYQITASVVPSTADNKKLRYSSSDESVAVVSSKGVVTSLKVGETVITVTTDEGGYKGEFKITVIPKIVKVTGVVLAQSKYVFNSIGEKYQIYASVVPSDAENKNLTYRSSDTDIVTVDENGVVTAVGYGIGHITVTSDDGGYSETFYAVLEKPAEPDFEDDTFVSKVITDGEIRGVWVSAVNNIDFPSTKGLSSAQLMKEIETILDNVLKWGLNTVFFQVRPMSDALYKSAIFPASSFVTGTQGNALSIDLLQIFIEEAHERGIELHAWINPYRISQKNIFGQNLNSLAETNPARLHPEWVVKYTDGAMYYNPGLPEVRELIVSGVEEIITNYNVDGIHFDDYFYPDGSGQNNKNPKSFDDAEAYAKYGNGLSLSDWRRSNVDTLILSVSNLIKNKRPSVKFGVSPSGIWAMKGYNENGVPGLNKTSQTYYDVYADSRKWVLNEWVDYICPQIYWNIDHSLAPFKNISSWWGSLCENTGVELYVGIAAYNGGTGSFNYTEYINQLTYLKNIDKCNGAVFFAYNDLVGNMGNITDVITAMYGGSTEDNPAAEVIPASDKLVLSTSKQTVSNDYTSTFILGVSDPGYPLLINGKEYEGRTATGYFAYYVTGLAVGENTVTFEHKGATVKYVITRKEASASSGYMSDFGFVSGSQSPKYDYASLSGTELVFSCNATAGATVYAMVGNYRVDMKTSAKKDIKDGKYRIGWYEGKLILPQTAGNTVLGSPVFYAEMDGKTAILEGTNVIEVINDPSSYVVRIIKDKCNLIANLSLDPDEYSFGTLGVTDTVVSKSKGYVKLSSGYYVATADVEKTFDTSLASSVAGNVTVADGGDFTHVIIPLMGKSNHDVWQYDDRTEITVYNVLNPNEVTALLAGDNALFSSVSVKALDQTTFKITLTYKKEGYIFGYYAAFDGDRLIVHYRNPAKISDGAKMLSGIRISIDPGHSDSTGALGFWGSSKGYEAELNLKLSRLVAERLIALGAEVRLSHNGEGVKDLDTLIKEFRAWNPDINVSIHFNSVADTADPNGARGVETYYSYVHSKLLSSTLLDSFCDLTGLTKRASKPGYYKVSRFPDFPSILFETAFISNPTEYEWFMNEENVDTAASAIVAGIVAYFTKISE